MKMLKILSIAAVLVSAGALYFSYKERERRNHAYNKFLCYNDNMRCVMSRQFEILKVPVSQKTDSMWAAMDRLGKLQNKYHDSMWVYVYLTTAP